MQMHVIFIDFTPPTRDLSTLCGRYRDLSFMRVRVCVAHFLLCQSIGIDETYTFQLQFFASMKIVGATGLGVLWALEWAWHIRVTNLRCGYGIQIRDPNSLSFIVSEITAVILTIF